MARAIHPSPPNTPSDLSDSATGLLSLLCLDAHDLATRHGLDTVYFLTREGICFQRFFDAFANGANWQTRSALFHASRLSTFTASLTKDGAQGLQRLLSQYQAAGWKQVLGSMDAWPPPDDIADIIGQPTKVALSGSALQRAAANDTSIAAWIDALAKERQRDLLGYVARHHPGLLMQQDAVLVDIGWRGTIQDNLALAIPGPRWHGLYFGLFPYLNAQPSNCDKHGILFENGRSETGPVSGNVMVVEYLFHAPVGSVVGYREGEPIYTAQNAGGEEDFSSQFQSKLLAQAASCGRALADAAQTFERERLLAVWRRNAATFMQQCQAIGPELFAAIRQFRHDEAFGLGRTVQIDDALSLNSMISGIFSRHTRSLFIQHSLAIPKDLRKSIKLGWWVRLWLLLHDTVASVRQLPHRKE